MELMKSAVEMELPVMVKFLYCCFLVFFGILFLQSGLDKVVDWKGNLGWLQGYFAKSPLRRMVTGMLGVVTVMEVVAGGLNAACAVLIWVINPVGWALPFWALGLGMVTLLMLFFGQRMAKDYPGAAGIVPYFVMGVLGLGMAIVVGGGGM